MKTPLTYGFISALAGALLTLLLYFAGFHDSPDKLASAQIIAGCVGLVIVVTCLSLAMRDKRATAPADAEWGYGSALGVGTLTALVNSVLGAIFYFIYASFINPSFADTLLQSELAKAEAKGASATQLANMEPMMRKFMSPGVSACMQLIFGFIFCFVIALIVAIFFRKPRPAMAGGEVPPPMA
jgi:hypothetical protein